MIARLRTALSKVIGLFRRRALDERLEEEIGTHIDLLVEQYEARGMDPQTARQAARREFGVVAPVQELYREQRGLPRLEALIRDVWIAGRSLCRDRALMAVCVASLGLAIGAGTAIFSAYEAAVLRPLPFRDSGNIVLAFETSQSGRHLTSLPNLNDWRQRSSVFSALSGLSVQTMALSGNGEAERVRGGFVSPEFFQVLQVDPALGSLHLRSGTRQAVISNRLWTNRFKNRKDIGGIGILLNGEAYSVVGVLRPDFAFPIDEIDVWVPAENYATSMKLARDLRAFFALGRLRLGASLESAESSLRTVAAGLEREFPQENAGHSVSLMRFRDFLSEGVRGTMTYMLGAVAILLLAACSNVGGLLASRATQRQRQFALQAALGASRLRILRQLLAEGLTIGVGGGIVGVLITWLATNFLPSTLPDDAIATGVPAINNTVLIFCVGISMIAGLLAGLLPAVTLSRTSLELTLREDSQHATSGRSKRVREGFLVTQVAASMILLVGSAALLAGLLRMLNANLGISNADNVLTMEYRVNRAKFASRKEQWEFHRRVEEGIKAIPGVRVAGLARAVPYSGNGGSIEFEPPGGPLFAGEAPQAVFNTVTSDYFTAMGIPLLQGRSCGNQDIDSGTPAILVNERLAARLWPDQSPLGRSLVIKEWATATVVGVVAGNRQNDIRRDPPWQIYACYSQNPGTLAAIVMRTNGDLHAIADAAKRLVWRIDGDQAVWKIRTMQSLIDLQTRDQRTVAALISAFAFFAVFLALAGVYGMASYNAARRVKEIGIRMALGARSWEILSRSVSRTFALVAAGVCIGAVVAPLLTSGPIGGAAPFAMVVLCAVFLVTAASFAAIRPGLRALRTNPMDVLRHE